MEFAEFERLAARAFEEIPQEYLEGIDGLTISRDAPAHPSLPGVFTLGECRTEDHLSDYGSPETTRSVIALYWGSFGALAELNPDFDWEEEIWETLTHELRHHLESLAGDAALEGVDYAADETFKRQDGLSFDPWYYQQGEALGDGLYKVEQAYYLERVWREEDFEAATTIDFDWYGVPYRIPRPDRLGDVHFVFVGEVDDGPATLELVLVRRRSWWRDLLKLSGTSRPVVLESEAEAQGLSEG